MEVCLKNMKFKLLKLFSFITKEQIIGKVRKYTSIGASSFIERTHTCGELRRQDVGKVVVLCGWLQYLRMNKFLLLRDWDGMTQLLLTDEMVPYEQVSDLTYESVLKVHGVVQARLPGQENLNMGTGDIEVKVKDLKVLNPSKGNLPFEIKNFHNVKESLRMEYRYLDLRTKRMQHNLRLRSKMVMKMREFLCYHHNFVDVETPTLFRKTPGGAREFIVPTHYPEKFYCLPQSPQQFKQLLMVGGIDRYFQIARCYRDEGSKPNRQPEFTQVDIEMSFVDQNGILCLTEQLLKYSWPEEKRKPIVPFPRLTYNESVQRFGSDKPDIRFGMELCDVSNCFKKCGISFIEDTLQEENGSVQALKIDQGTKYLTNKDVVHLEDAARNLNPTIRTDVTVIKIKDGKWQSPIIKYLKDDTKHQLTRSLQLLPGDIFLLAAGEKQIPNLLLGKLRLACADLLESKGITLRNQNIFSFVWIVDFPLFLPKESGDGLESAHHPFTAAAPEDVNLLYTIPEKVKSQHYDLILNGNEIGGGSIRIHSEKVQKYVLTEILKEDSAQLQHLLDALGSGCPPHGGIALGLDRLLAIINNELSIRNVIAFPKSLDGKDLMSKAPAQISDMEKQYYQIYIKNPKS